MKNSTDMKTISINDVKDSLNRYGSSHFGTKAIVHGLVIDPNTNTFEFEDVVYNMSDISIYAHASAYLAQMHTKTVNHNLLLKFFENDIIGNISGLGSSVPETTTTLDPDRAVTIMDLNLEQVQQVLGYKVNIEINSSEVFNHIDSLPEGVVSLLESALATYEKEISEARRIEAEKVKLQSMIKTLCKKYISAKLDDSLSLILEVKPTAKLLDKVDNTLSEYNYRIDISKTKAANQDIFAEVFTVIAIAYESK